MLTCMSSTVSGSNATGKRLARIASPTSRLTKERNEVRSNCEDVDVVISATMDSRSTLKAMVEKDPEGNRLADDDWG